MHKLRGAALLVSLSCLGIGSAHATQWSKTFGGKGEDVARSVQPTPDGGYIVAGHTQSFGVSGDDPFFPSDNAWVVKLDADGNITWQKTYGGPGYDLAFSVGATPDGGYVVAGSTELLGTGGLGAWVLKLDQVGNVIWQMASGGKATTIERAESVQPTADGGYVVAGYSQRFGAGSNDAWVIKLDASGTILWQKTYGGSSVDFATAVAVTADGGYVVAGSTNSTGAGGSKALVLRLDSTGNVIWQKTYGGAGNEGATSIHQTQDGGFIVAGSTSSFGAGGEDAWVFKLDGVGNVIWQKTYGGTGIDGAASVYPTPDGYIVAGSTTSFGAANFEGWVFKLDTTGNLVWQRTYGGTNGAFVYSARPTADGGYILVGETASFGAGGTDAWILKLGADGTITGCPIMESSNAIPTNSSAVGQTGPASVAASTAVLASTAVSPLASTAVPQLQCQAPLALVARDIPTLSEWTLIALSAIVGWLGFLHRRRLR